MGCCFTEFPIITRGGAWQRVPYFQMARKEVIRIITEVDVTYNDNPCCNLTDNNYSFFKQQLEKEIKRAAADVINSRKVHDIHNQRMIVKSSLFVKVE